MLRNSKDIAGQKLLARDGAIGLVKDLYFDEQEWTVRYLVVDTGGWLSGRKVLISPHSLRSPASEEEGLLVDLTREQVKNSPGIETDQPVSRQQQTALHEFYGWPHYWAAGAYAGGGAAPYVLQGQSAQEDEPMGDPHLHSVNEVKGYRISATDGHIGHVEDFLITDTGWAVRYLVIDTKNWWPGKKVLVAPEWANHVSWSSREVTIDLTQATIKLSPEYDPSKAVQQQYADSLHDFYQRPRHPLE